MNLVGISAWSSLDFTGKDKSRTLWALNYWSSSILSKTPETKKIVKGKRENGLAAQFHLLLKTMMKKIRVLEVDFSLFGDRCCWSEKWRIGWFKFENGKNRNWFWLFLARFCWCGRWCDWVIWLKKWVKGVWVARCLHESLIC